MGVTDKLKGIFGIDDDYDDEDELLEEEEESGAENTFKADFSQQTRTPAPSATASSYKPREKEDGFMSFSQKLRVVLVKPERYEEAMGIANSLMEKKTVVLNLESTNKDTARRLVDFLSGVAYANKGNVQKVANLTYLITPYSVDFSGVDTVDSDPRYNRGEGIY